MWIFKWDFEVGFVEKHGILKLPLIRSTYTTAMFFIEFDIDSKS